MNITFSLSKDNISFFNKAYVKYINISTSKGEPVYSRSEFFFTLVSDWYVKTNLKEAVKK